MLRAEGSEVTGPEAPDKRAEGVIRTSKSFPCYVIGFFFAHPPACGHAPDPLAQ